MPYSSILCVPKSYSLLMKPPERVMDLVTSSQKRKCSLIVKS